MHKTIHIVLFLSQFGAMYDLPAYIKPCVNNPNLSSCSQRVLESLRPYLVKGIPEFNIPPIDPLHVSNLKATRTGSHIACYNATFENMLWIGGKDFQILDIVIKPDELTFRLKLGFPYLHIQGDGFIDAKALNFNLNDSGIFHLNYSNIVLDVVLNGETYDSGDYEFIRWRRENVEINFDESYLVHLTGFLKDSTYVELLRLSLNNAARIFVVGFRTVIDVGVGDFIVQIINRVHERIPKDMLYLGA